MEAGWQGAVLFICRGENDGRAGETGNQLRSPPVALFQTHLRQPISAQDMFSYDVTSDGQMFLINTKVDEPNAAPLSVILNWASEIEK